MKHLNSYILLGLNGAQFPLGFMLLDHFIEHVGTRFAAIFIYSALTIAAEAVLMVKVFKDND